MSEDTTSSQKRVLFTEDMDVTTGVVYPKSPMPRSPRIPKTMAHYPSSPSGQGSSKFRHKSPTSRHLSPHRSISKNKIIYDWENVNNSIRKTQSTALPALINAPWPRSTTVSTPDLKVEDQSIGTDDVTRDGNFNRRVNRRTKFYYHFQLIFVILNCIILAAGLIHLGAALIMTIYNEIVLIIVEYRTYVPYIIILYIHAIILIVLSLTGLWAVVHHGSRKTHIVCSLLVVVFTITLSVLQGTVHTNVQLNARERMMESIGTQPEVATSTRIFWDYIQKTFKCCGTDGHLDWCEKTDLPDDNENSIKKFLGSYICHIPASCCIDDIDLIMSSEKFTRYSQKSNVPCSVFPTPWNTQRVGCLGHVKREIQYVGKLLKIVNFGSGILLFISSAIAAALFFFPHT